MPKFRKKPVVIEAIQWQADGIGAAPTLMSKDWESLMFRRDGCALIIETLKGDLRADPGDWIIRDVAGEYYPCRPDIFEATYEPVD